MLIYVSHYMSSILKRLPAEAPPFDKKNSLRLNYRFTKLCASYLCNLLQFPLVLPPKAITLVVPSSDLKENTLEDRGEQKSGLQYYSKHSCLEWLLWASPIRMPRKLTRDVTQSINRFPLINRTCVYNNTKSQLGIIYGYILCMTT